MKLYANLGYLYDEMKERNLEDYANIIYFNHELSGTINLNRHSSVKKDEFIIYGEDGELQITPETAKLFDRFGKLIDSYVMPENYNYIKIMLDTFVSKLDDKEYCQKHFKHHCDVVGCIDNIYKDFRNIL